MYKRPQGHVKVPKEKRREPFLARMGVSDTPESEECLLDGLSHDQRPTPSPGVW
jgi:hypothetical protein